MRRVAPPQERPNLTRARGAEALTSPIQGFNRRSPAPKSVTNATTMNALVDRLDDAVVRLTDGAFRFT